MMADIDSETGETWSTSVSELMAIFRECLVTIQPPLSRARIWPACYDDWDAIVGALWKNVVIKSIEFAVPDQLKEDPKLEEGFLTVPVYSLTYLDYRNMSFVDVVHKSLDAHKLHPFRTFSYLNEPLFAEVGFSALNASGAVVEEGYVPAHEASFRFQLRRRTGDLHSLDSITVKL